MSTQARIFIDGEAGTTGLGIRDRLRGLPVDVLSIDPDKRKDVDARREMMRDADLVVLCLPDAASREAADIAHAMGDAAPRLLDASSAFRTAPGWVYGFPEIASGHAQTIAQAARVSNPGCYATGAIALLKPLVDAGIINSTLPLSINAISGYSGGGRTMIEAHDEAGGPAFELYALGLEHKHLPEIVHHSGLEVRPVFVPSVGHFAQGMIVSIPLHLSLLDGKQSSDSLLQTLRAHYAGSGVVRVCEDEAVALVGEALAGEDVMELRVHGNDGRGHAVLTARLDNLGKGASGAALQNIRLMLGV